MNIALNSKVTADKSRDTYRETSGQFDDTAFSGAACELAQMSVAQTREAYERSKNALDAAVDTMARSFDALGQSAAAAQQNANSGFDLVKSLATAKTLAEMV
jgi:hypothetical protein